MNSVEFERRLGATPRDPALKEMAGLSVTPDAQLQLARALAFERRVEQALQQIAVPEQLALRILAAQSELAVSPTRRNLLRVAAGVGAVSLVGALCWKLVGSNAEATLAAACVEHLSHEPFALARTEEVAEPLVRAMFASHGVQLNASPGPLVYLSPCGLKGQQAIHALAQEPAGPVTVMYVPQAGLHKREFRHGASVVRVAPYARGALVLVAESNRDFNQVEQRFRQSLV